MQLWLLVVLGVFVLLLYSTFESVTDPSSVQRHHSLDTLVAHRSNVPSLADSDTLSCSQIDTKRLDGSWKDPNDGQIYARHLTSDPSYILAVHREAYDPVRWEHVFLKGRYYETEVHDRFVTILREAPPSAVVLDVGTNIGVYTLLSASMGRQVLSFEINPSNLMRLCESLALNKLEDHVAILQKGVSNADDEELAVWVPKNPGQAFMKPIEETHEKDQDGYHALTKTITLDTLAKQRGWFRKPGFEIAILKLDVEGKEPQIVEGAQKLLASGKVLNVLTEFRRLGRDHVQTALKTLLDSGFTLIHEKEGKVSIDRSRILLDELKDELSGKGKNVDLWFQRA